LQELLGHYSGALLGNVSLLNRCLYGMYLTKKQAGSSKKKPEPARMVLLTEKLHGAEHSQHAPSSGDDDRSTRHEHDVFA
jgi:hypothetical protein